MSRRRTRGRGGRTEGWSQADRQGKGRAGSGNSWDHSYSFLLFGLTVSLPIGTHRVFHHILERTAGPDRKFLAVRIFRRGFLPPGTHRGHLHADDATVHLHGDEPSRQDLPGQILDAYTEG